MKVTRKDSVGNQEITDTFFYLAMILRYAMVTNHLRAPYGVYFTKNRTILRRPCKKINSTKSCSLHP